ncbi:RluA family pseudouridine synthase [Hahella sp. HN01]|uniref:RluA family pseudouridine synthase n=1 Tax=Hahella sp. HN01 TaxID=2847262 RepID=UPI001C1F0CFF|nr:RluA family pseudouridine synthase [Hahella sp. HN01]MBU6954383.1 RluA family pseudouridine synthase [Hahella sp. HN01]
MPSDNVWRSGGGEVDAQSRWRRKLIVGEAVADASTWLAAQTGLSKQKVKDAMLKGAVWWKRGGKPQKRLRRAKSALAVGDVLELNYDPQILALNSPQPTLVADHDAYSIWCKPAGLLTQGSEWGDHCSLLRMVELHFQSKRQVFLLHRLDREAMGLVIIAHNKAAAGRFGALLQNNALDKFYLARVKGRLAQEQGEIDFPVDGKAALSYYQVQHYDEATDSSLVRVKLITGRKHQIRRHFADLGHPLLGDPRYGSGNKHEDGLMLAAMELAFNCPMRRRAMRVIMPEGLLPAWAHQR